LSASQRPDRQRVRHAAVDMIGQDRLRPLGVAFQRAIQQRAVLLDGGAAAVLQGVAEIFVEHDGVGLHQFARAAARDQGLMEFAVVALAQFGVVAFGEDRALGGGELVMGRDHAAFPFHVAGAEGFGHRVMLEQDAQLREFAQVLDRDRGDLETALAFGDDKAFRGQPVQDLAQRRDADAVVFLHRLQFQPPGGRQHAEDDVGADALIAAVAGGQRVGLGMFKDVKVLIPF
jgi:hypothetical protein